MARNKLALTIPMSEIEEGAREQISTLCNCAPVKKLAIMPDVHKGYDAPIGSVVKTRKYVSPGMIGYDIGCGVMTMITKLKLNSLNLDVESLRDRAYTRIKAATPIINDKIGVWHRHFEIKDFESSDASLAECVNVTTKAQFGTLGSGNHFLEVGVNTAGFICITAHTGSRRSGWLIGDYWMKRAKEFGHEFNGLSFLKLGSPMADRYRKEYAWAADYAHKNRKCLLRRTALLLGITDYHIKQSQFIDSVHNMFHFQGPKIAIHRKGAIPAYDKQLAVIPANMRDGVFVVRGVGNTRFLRSASHGAGRVLSRNKAKATFSTDDLESIMTGIHCNITDVVCEEHPHAYKDIGYVLDKQDGITITVLDRIKPIINIKG